MNLEDLGWNTLLQEHYAGHRGNNLIPARVSFQGREIYRIIAEKGEFQADISGALRHESLSSGNLPACGDWVIADNPLIGSRTVIRFILPRKTSFIRKQAGTAIGSQVIAANIDTVCLVSGLDSDFNPRRIERYLAITYESGAIPVIVLNKADVCSNIHACIVETKSLAPGVPVLAVSAIDGIGMDDIAGCVGRGQTLALLGSSGVGKSSIVNRLLGRPVQKVCETDADTGRGVHTTAARHLFLLPSGGLIMDTPGIRELQLWPENAALNTVFDDIRILAEECRFRDCSHQNEPGCRVRDAVVRGELDAGRLAGYFKLCKEVRYFELKTSHSADWIERDRWKKIKGTARKRLSKRD
jgi:ribosome biogenesis GTPase / thiamine phosphate phosphatase